MNNLIISANSAFLSKNTLAFIKVLPTEQDNILALYYDISQEKHLMETALLIVEEYSFKEYLKEYISFVFAYQNSDLLERWLSSLNLCNSFISMYAKEDNFWLTKALKGLAKMSFDLYLETPDCTQKKINSVKMGEFLQRAVKVQMSDRNPLPNSKRAGIYSMINFLMHFSIYSGSMGSIAGLVANIKRSGPLLSEFSLADQVTFRYWMVQINRAANNDTSVLNFRQILTAFQVSTQDSMMDYIDAECIVSNLIDQ
ncbi:hypothetical protein BB561_004918 [Smittium simulii]|uniref:Uncharacterized protein n=1 Tax=Smittium simulii TaxID=133385 RepID=A0A2T9YDC7_9FUNG|nr:hypothetical protein BB561_004918 [Smittium simulii]